MGSGPGTAPKHQCLSLSVWYHNTGALSQKKFTFFYHNTFGELLYVDNSMFLKHFHVLPANKIYIKKEP
jgi:hypothetical protein